MRHWTGVNTAPILDYATKDAIRRISVQLAEHDKAISGVSAGSGSSGGGVASASFITVANEAVLSAERALAVQPPITKTDGGANGSLTIGINTAVPTGGYGTTALGGSAPSVIRSDARFKYPEALMSLANSTTLTLTDDAVDQTLTGSLGALNLRPSADTLSLPAWTGGGKLAATVGTILGFTQTSTALGTSLLNGLTALVTWNDGSTYDSKTHRGGQFRVTHSTGTTFTNATVKVLEADMAGTTFSTGTHTYTERTGLNVLASMPLQSGSGVVTVTDVHAIRVLNWPVVGTGGTYTNVRGMRMVMPTVGATIRRGFSLESVISNVGTESANAEGFYCEDMTRGTAQRVNYYAEGATNTTPTDVYAFYQGTAHAVGTNRYGARYTGATTGTPTLCVGVQVDKHAVGTTARSFIGNDQSDMLFVTGAYAPGSVTVATGQYAIMSRRLQLTGAQRATLAGTATLRLT